MSSNEKAYDMQLILGEVHSLQLKDCSGNVILIKLLTRKTFFHVWLNESKLKVSFSLNITKLHILRCPIRDERTAEILASTELNPYDDKNEILMLVVTLFGAF